MPRSSPVSSVRSSLAWASALRSPISSRNSVPVCASSNRPEPALGGAGERAPLVPEHLGLDQVARDGGAVDRDEGPAGAPARAVDRGRGQLLARAALAGDQHARLGRRHPLDQRADLLHRRALAHQRRPAAQLRVQRAVLGPGAVELQRGSHGDQHRLRRQRLLQELEGAQLDGAHRVGELGLAAHHDDRHLAAALAQAGERLEPVGARRHHQVEQDDVRDPRRPAAAGRRCRWPPPPRRSPPRGAARPASGGCWPRRPPGGSALAPSPAAASARRTWPRRRASAATRDGALVHLDRLLREREAEAGAPALARDVGVEDAVQPGRPARRGRGRAPRCARRRRRRGRETRSRPWRRTPRRRSGARCRTRGAAGRSGPSRAGSARVDGRAGPPSSAARCFAPGRSAARRGRSAPRDPRAAGRTR